MYKFAIRNKVYDDKIVGYLCYDEDLKEYHIEIPNAVKSFEAPLILADFIQKGQREIGARWSLRWVQGRVVPPERQNIGQILKENGMEFYDEFSFLLKNQGRSCQDECYLAVWKSDYVNSEEF